MDGRFVKGWGTVAVNTTGGSATHSHTSPSHTHTMVNHTHTYSLPAYGGSTEDHSDDGDHSNYIADEPHTHSGTSGSVSGGSLTGSATIGNGSNNPPYYEVVYIKANSYSFIPPKGMVFRNDTTIPDGFSFCDGNNDTPNLVNKFIRGAGTGADAGATGGGDTHSHTYNHSHPNASHSHSSANSNTTGHGAYRGSFSSSNQHAARQAHTHSVSLNSTSTASNSATGSFTSSTLLPLHKTLRINKNTSGSSKLPRKGDIAIWLNSDSTVPVGWLPCNGSGGTPNLQNYYIYSSDTPGNTGGSNTHTHSGVASHTHTATGTHSHSGSSGNSNLNTQTGVGSHSTARVHSHSVTSVQSRTASWNSTTISANSSNNEPEYRAVVYIQFEFPPVIPNPILMMMVDSPENV